MSETIATDYIVVGSGIAGLRAAIEIAGASREVVLLTKDLPTDSNTELAQGGIAAALSEEDEIALHERDTLAAGDGLCEPAAVRVLVEEGPRCVYELIDWGAEFDRDGLRLAFTREGAHSKRRVLHARGDSTGSEIVRALLLKASTYSNIRFMKKTFTAGLALGGGECVGVVTIDEPSGRVVTIRARSVLLATGGCGQVYRETSNPPQATGDGMAIAHLAGAEMMDMEFIQFHPTALAVEGAPRFLLSEALRGEGAHLRGENGRRFLVDHHPQAELAPRDVVARAIVSETRRSGLPCVYLDMRHLADVDLRARFPRIFETVLAFGLDLRKDLIPVLPAAHYAMGGVGPTSWAAPRSRVCSRQGGRIDRRARREPPGVELAPGGLVFGARAGTAMLEEHEPAAGPVRRASRRAEPRAQRAWREPEQGKGAGSGSGQPAAATIAAEVKRISWERIGILRGPGPRLRPRSPRGLTAQASPDAPPRRSLLEARNLALVGSLIARAALFRGEPGRSRADRLSEPGRRALALSHAHRGAATVKVPVAEPAPIPRAS